MGTIFLDPVRHLMKNANKIPLSDGDPYCGNQMEELLTHLLDAPLANILILAGLLFLAVAVIGKISGKIEPSTSGRVMAGVLGIGLLVYGIHAHAAADGSSKKQGADAQNTPGRNPLEHSPKSSLTGNWKNDDPQTRGITRLAILQVGETVNVHAWGACSPQDCDWGAQPAATETGSASVAWDQGFVLRKMTLAPDAGRLRMSLDSVYRDNRSPQHSQEYFVRAE